MHILYNCTAENKSVLGLFGLNVNRGTTDLFYSVCHCMCSSAAFEADNHQEQDRNKTDRPVQKKAKKVSLKILLMSEDIGQTVSRWQEGHSNSNNHWLQPRYGEKHLWICRWAAAAEDHTGCCFCQLRTGIPSMVGLEIGINNMKGCLRPTL